METGSVRPISAVLLIAYDKTSDKAVAAFHRRLRPPVQAAPEGAGARTAEIVDLAAYRRWRLSQRKDMPSLTRSYW